MPHPDFGEGVVAVVVGDEIATSEEAILSAISPELARYKQPKRVFFTDALPRNAMGKVQKKLLRDAYSKTFNP